jgi:hypothetical protein
MRGRYHVLWEPGATGVPAMRENVRNLLHLIYYF